MKDDYESYKVDIKTPWFKLVVDKITWKEVIVVAMALSAIVYIIKG